MRISLFSIFNYILTLLFSALFSQPSYDISFDPPRMLVNTAISSSWNWYCCSIDMSARPSTFSCHFTSNEMSPLMNRRNVFLLLSYLSWIFASWGYVPSIPCCYFPFTLGWYRSVLPGPVTGATIIVERRRSPSFIFVPWSSSMFFRPPRPASDCTLRYVRT